MLSIFSLYIACKWCLLLTSFDLIGSNMSARIWAHIQFSTLFFFMLWYLISNYSKLIVLSHFSSFLDIPSLLLLCDASFLRYTFDKVLFLRFTETQNFWLVFLVLPSDMILSDFLWFYVNLWFRHFIYRCIDCEQCWWQMWVSYYPR